MRRFYILLFMLASCFSTAVMAQAPASKPDPELKKRAVLEGHWTYVGEYKPGPLGPGGKTSGEYDAQMILGGFFLQSQATGKGATGEIHELEIVAYDRVNKNFVSSAYLDNGTTSSGVMTVSGNTMTLAGTFAVAGTQYQFREPFVLSPDLMSATEKGEISVDGQTWTLFFEARYTKTKPAAKR